MLNGTIGTVFAIVLYNNFTSWLTFLGSTLPAIGAIGATVGAGFLARPEKD